MFNQDFYPTPKHVAEMMINMIDISGKTILEPSAGAGNLVAELIQGGANVIACENEPRLKMILENYCDVIENDFFKLTPERISHIHAIIMNPPFRNAEKHIEHAFNIAPDGCEIISLCNSETLNNRYSQYRKRLHDIISNYGFIQNWGNCFNDSERQTDVNVSMIYIKKPGSVDNDIYNEFYLDKEPNQQGEGIMQYDVVRDIVNRYVEALKLYDKQIELGQQMHYLVNEFTNTYTGQKIQNYLILEEKEKSNYQIDFKKNLQKAAWSYVIDKVGLEKYSTRELKKDINKFVENQINVPFTMKNIYKMFEIIIGTTSSRMDKALEEVFDNLTKHYHENRYNLEGWKTNSHYLINKKFIINYMCSSSFSGSGIDLQYNGNEEIISDAVKALCYISGKQHNKIISLRDKLRGYKYNSETGEQERTNEKPNWGEWFDWEFFECRCYKKGTMHFKFKDLKIWEMFNYNVARIKGFPLPEKK